VGVMVAGTGVSLAGRTGSAGAAAQPPTRTEIIRNVKQRSRIDISGLNLPAFQIKAFLVGFSHGESFARQ